MITVLRLVLANARLRPSRGGPAGDLTLDLGAHDTAFTPPRIALTLSATITLVMLTIGIRSDDPLAGVTRGLLDAGLCMSSFIIRGEFVLA